MKINLSNFETSDVSLFDVSIVQRDVGGGKTEKEDIDCLEEYPTAKSLIISGLNQECFEYLIKHYGSQFEAISFWKNKSVSDLSPLEDLTNVNSHRPNISSVISGYKQPSKSAQSIEITGFIEKSKPSQIIFFYTLLPLTA